MALTQLWATCELLSVCFNRPAWLSPDETDDEDLLGLLWCIKTGPDSSFFQHPDYDLQFLEKCRFQS